MDNQSESVLVIYLQSVVMLVLDRGALEVLEIK